MLFRSASDQRPIVMTLDVGASSLRSLDVVELQTNAGRAALDIFSLLLRVTDVSPHDLGGLPTPST
ncbi:hypothetical protein DVA67_002865 [Solirubrobacter sp. CPCC 204708]|uniref:FXSXX-COOH protein n=1 Tax=Solirubrobacter deserti TaxID=2282478 RepID=A0ABT4RNN6_9ACTN|nr:hypothetical protein [Solirubrobacter deserti]MBE2314903.1 hypothetical protein [Solirubrobacter deserti]MDA0140132.1 hypothetical protein [Solirubrobacter deserti]